MLYEKYLKQGTPMFVREVNESIEVSKNEDLVSFFTVAFSKFKDRENFKISQKELKYLYLPFYIDDIEKNIKIIQKTDKKNKKLEKLKQKLKKISKELDTKHKNIFTLVDKLNLRLSQANKKESVKKIISSFEKLISLAREYQNDIDKLELLKEDKYQDYISKNQSNDYIDTEYIAEDDEQEVEEEEDEIYYTSDDDLDWLGYGAVAGVALLGAGALCYALCGKSKDSLI